jgi:hypothetical protein
MNIMKGDKKLFDYVVYLPDLPDCFLQDTEFILTLKCTGATTGNFKFDL